MNATASEEGQLLPGDLLLAINGLEAVLSRGEEKKKRRRAEENSVVQQEQVQVCCCNL